MPRNCRPRDREEKRGEIIAAAARLFTEAGYDSTSMAKVAVSAGVTTNTIYWDFEDKDALLVGVLDHVLSEGLAAASLHAEEPWVDQLLWAVEQLEQYNRLVTVVHAEHRHRPSSRPGTRTSTSSWTRSWPRGFAESV